MNPASTWFLLRRFSLRHWRLAPKQSALLVLILALGVAVFVAVRLANRAAVASFSNFTETLTGQSDWTLQAPAGPLPESVLPELRAALGPRAVNIIPVVEVAASPPPSPGAEDKYSRPTYTLLGVDLISVANLARSQDKPFFAQAPDATAGRGADTNGDFWASFNGGPQLWLSRDWPAPRPGQLELILNDSVHTLPVAGVIPSIPDAPPAPPTLLILDLPHLQTLAGKRGFIDRVEFLVEAGPRLAERREELRVLLETLGANGARWSVTASGARRDTAEAMTRAFRLNLTILSLIALLVGLYLIFQALDGAVVRRRPEIAILRSLGVEERAIRRVWLWESALLGLVGGALGLLLGWAGAQLAVRAVARTVNVLYYATTVDSACLTPAEIALGLALGLCAALVAGWWPAREAARTPPAQVLQRGAVSPPGQHLLRNSALGLACILAGVACAQLPPLRFDAGSRFPFAGYAAAFLWIFGAGILCSFLLPPFARAARAFGKRFAPARVALGHLRAPSGRHRLAAAALLCAIGMTAGMAILVASFERTMQGWVKRTLQADLYVSSAGAQSASSQSRISADTARALAEHPAVVRSAAIVSYPISLDGIPTVLSGSDLADPASRPEFTWIGSPPADVAFDPSQNASLALVSESFTERFRVRSGDTLTLPTPSGPRAVTISGIFADYGNERGSVLLERRHVRAWFAEDSVTSVALYTRPGIDADTLRAELVARHPALTVLTNAKLRAEVLRIFRQTFSITYALEVIGVVVAMTGLALTLVSVLLDRRDELTTLRALGFRRREIALAASLEGVAVSACAVIGGLLLSGALGWLLIHVINKQSFGWTLAASVPWGQLAALAAIILTTGAVVSYCVGLWAADLPADREE